MTTNQNTECLRWASRRIEPQAEHNLKKLVCEWVFLTPAVRLGAFMIPGGGWIFSGVLYLCLTNDRPYPEPR